MKFYIQYRLKSEFLFKCDIELSCGYLAWAIIVVDSVDICGGGFEELVDFGSSSGCVIYWNCKFIWRFKAHVSTNFTLKNSLKVSKTILSRMNRSLISAMLSTKHFACHFYLQMTSSELICYKYIHEHKGSDFLIHRKKTFIYSKNINEQRLFANLVNIQQVINIELKWKPFWELIKFLIKT